MILASYGFATKRSLATSMIFERRCDGEWTHLPQGFSRAVHWAHRRNTVSWKGSVQTSLASISTAVIRYSGCLSWRHAVEVSFNNYLHLYCPEEWVISSCGTTFASEP